MINKIKENLRGITIFEFPMICVLGFIIGMFGATNYIILIYGCLFILILLLIRWAIKENKFCCIKTNKK